MSSTSPTDRGLFKAWRPQSVFGSARPDAPILSVEVNEHVDTMAILEVLNRQRRSRLRSRDLKDALERAAFNRQTRAESLFRELIDEWIDSGYSLGADHPSERSLDRAENVLTAVVSASRSGQLTLGSNASGTGLALSIRSSEEPRGTLFESRDSAQRFAQEQIACVLLSDLRFKLAKCRTEACGSYFTLSHWNRPYKNGTRCEECRTKLRSNQAVALTSSAREGAIEKLCSLAASKYRKRILADRLWHKREDLKRQIADFLSERVAQGEETKDSIPIVRFYPKGVTVKWISRHVNWDLIESIAKRRDAGE
jgi:hypothetical protein